MHDSLPHEIITNKYDITVHSGHECEVRHDREPEEECAGGQGVRSNTLDGLPWLWCAVLETRKDPQHAADEVYTFPETGQ